MNAIDAVEVVLDEAGGPLGYEEITKRVLAKGLWQTKGLTPDATINARLAVDIKDLGAGSRFQRTGPGVFALRKWGLPEVAARGAKGKQAKALADESKPEDAQPPATVAVGPDDAAAVEEKTPPLSNDKFHAKSAALLSFTDAAEAMLEQFGNKKPMHYRAITEKALELRLVSTKGLTPEATLYAQVLTDTKRRARRGEPPRFVMHGKGMIGLAEWVPGGLLSQIEQFNEGVRKKLLAQLMAMDPQEFQKLIVDLLDKLGFEDVTMMPFSGDGGIDVRATLMMGDVVITRMAVQVKRWKHNVQAPDVQRVRGSLGVHEQGLVITTSDFSKGARKEAEQPNKTPVALMNGKQLVGLLADKHMGVHETGNRLIELGEEE